MTCEHDTIITWRDEAANPVMWSCMVCARKFVPLTRQMIDDEGLLRQALYLIEAWERGCDLDAYDREIYETSTAIRARLGETT